MTLSGNAGVPSMARKIVAFPWSKDDMTQAFRLAFERNSQPNNTEKVANLDARFQTAYRDFCESHSSTCDCANYRISVEDVFNQF